MRGEAEGAPGPDEWTEIFVSSSATSLLLELGVKPETVQAMGGWADQAIMRRVYGHVSLDEQRRAAAALDSALAGLEEMPVEEVPAAV